MSISSSFYNMVDFSTFAAPHQIIGARSHLWLRESFQNAGCDCAYTDPQQIAIGPTHPPELAALTLAIFDLDHTLLDGDTDYLWSNYLCDQGVLERSAFEQRYQAQNSEYDGGTLSPTDYTYSLIDTIAHLPTSTLKALLTSFSEEVVPARIAPAAMDLLQYHRDRGDFLLIITATVEFLAQCSIQALPVDDFIATRVEWHDDRPTARLIGTASFREGKVTRLKQWLAERDHSLDQSWFYSDSINDLPMLELVDNPVAVNADANLRAIAEARNWPQLTIRLSDQRLQNA